MRLKFMTIFVTLSVALGTVALTINPATAQSVGPNAAGSWQQHTLGDWSRDTFGQTELAQTWWTRTGLPGSTPVSGTASIAAFDANGDNHLDLALGMWGDDYLYLNNGSGSFELADAGDFGDEQDFNSTMVAFDADGDSDTDLVVGYQSSLQSYALFKNDGAAHFTRADAGELDDSVLNSVALNAFDANGDGALDLLVSNYTTPMLPPQVFLNDGNGSFTRSEAGELDDAGPQARCFTTVDIDGDGDQDVFAGFANAANALYLNDGAGQFTRVDTGDFDNAVHFTTALVVFDANGDGALDVAAGYGDQEHLPNALFLNRGNHQFMRSDAGDFDNTAKDTVALIAFDADNDGDQDLASVCKNYGACRSGVLFTNDGAGRFAQVQTGVIETNSERGLSAVAFDADHDGDQELAIGAETPFSIFQNHWNDATCVVLAYQGLVAGSGDAFYEPTHQAARLISIDIDGDGDLDIATAQERDALAGSGQVYRNDGAGNFVRLDAGDFNTKAQHIYDLVTLDADNDGDQDLLVGMGQENQSVALYDNNGSGHFTRTQAGELTTLTGTTYSLTAFDADGDGDQDVATITAGNSVSLRRLYLNNGQGLFTAGDGGDFTSIGDTGYDVLAADLDGDNDQDLVVAKNDSGVIYLNNGQGRFTRGAPVTALENKTAHSMGVLDADGDGDLDLFTYFHNGMALLLHNDGTGQFTEAQTSGLQSLAGLEAWAILDADRDGSPDLVMGRQNQTGALYLNNGSGVFTHSPSPLFSDFTTHLRALLALDVDGDGDADLAATSNGVKAAYKNDGQGALTQYDAGDFSDKNGWLTYAIAHLDFDGDGDQDMVVGRQEQRNSAYRNDGTGHFSRIDAGDFDNTANRVTALAPLDADGDGDLDLAVANGAWPYTDSPYPGTSAEPVTRNALYLNNGSGLFQLADPGELDDNTHNSQALAAFDADGDGDTDLVVGNGSRIENGGTDHNELFLNNGAGRFTAASAGDLTSLIPPAYTLVAFDADGDGDIDVATGSTANNLLLNNGSGVFQRTPAGDFGSIAGARAASKLVAFDADNDGDTDLAASNDKPTYNGFQNTLYFNDGTGHFVRRAMGDYASTITDVIAMLAFDYDGDGDQDLAVGSDDTNRVYLNWGGGLFASARADDFTATFFTIALAAFDADGDGDLDLVAGGRRDSSLFFNKNLVEQGTVTSPIISPANTDPSAHVLAWTKLQVTEAVPTAAALTYDLLTAAATPIAGFSSLRPNASGEINIGGLNASLYPSIRLRATLSDLDHGADTRDQMPQLCSWRVSYEAATQRTWYFPTIWR